MTPGAFEVLDNQASAWPTSEGSATPITDSFFGIASTILSGAHIPDYLAEVILSQIKLGVASGAYPNEFLVRTSDFCPDEAPGVRMARCIEEVHILRGGLLAPQFTFSAAYSKLQYQATGERI